MKNLYNSNMKFAQLSANKSAEALSDVEGCERLCGVLSRRMEEICERLQESFQPIVHRRVSEKTGKQLKDSLKSLTHQDSRYLRGYKGLDGSQRSTQRKVQSLSMNRFYEELIFQRQNSSVNTYSYRNGFLRLPLGLKLYQTNTGYMVRS